MLTAYAGGTILSKNSLPEVADVGYIITWECKDLLALVRTRFSGKGAARIPELDVLTV